MRSVFLWRKIMTCQKIDLYNYFKLPRNGAAGGYLNAYAPDRSNEMPARLFPAMLVVAGGAYAFLSEREREPVALQFTAAQYVSFTLEYSLKTAHPAPLLEAAMAMAFIRENAERYAVRKDKVGVIGFSAGGHLALTLATMFDSEPVKRALGERAALVRPDAVISSYAVVTTKEGGTHGESARTISGGDAALRELLSIENRVTKNSAPAFIWHTGEDDAVPVENALLLASAYRKAGVPFELHVFEKGWHGLSVLNETVSSVPAPSFPARAWLPLALSWLSSRGFTVIEA